MIDSATFGVKFRAWIMPSSDLMSAHEPRITKMRTLNDLTSLFPQLTAAAQSEYDTWHQDEDGMDEELGAGGICHLIADQFVSILSEEGFEATSTHSGGVGENHVWVTAQIAEGVVTVDIPPGVYESGGGYTWRKLPDVVFSEGDIVVALLDRDPNRFAEYAGIEDWDLSP